MRSMIAVCILFLTSGVSGQVPHTFQNGQAADADKVNENFEYVLDNASGGCSATQQDSSVVIECADGSHGVCGFGCSVAVDMQLRQAPRNALTLSNVIRYSSVIFT